MRDENERRLIMTATPQDTTVRVNMPVSEDAEASYDGPVKPAPAEASDGVPAIAPDAQTRLERSWDGPAPDLSTAYSVHDAVEAIDADAPTAIVTPLEVGYRLAVIKAIAMVANENVRAVVGIAALSVTVIHDDGKLAVELRVLRWKQFAAWYRTLAIRDFVDLKSTLAAFPPEIRVGARSLLRQLTDKTHEAWTDEVRMLRL